MADKVFTCIICPKSCRITVKETPDGLKIEGYECKRGLEHVKKERHNPMRMLTTTIRLKNSDLRRLPVICNKEIPKAKIADCLKVLYNISVCAPVKCGDTVVKNICDTGADIISSRTVS